MFQLNGLLLKNDSFLNVSRFSKVSHFGQNQLSLEKMAYSQK
jgi:hypothetical protein